MGSSRGAVPADASRSEHAALLLLLAAAGLVRWIAWQRSAVLFNDGPHFLAIAQAFEAGDWTAALGAQYHPLYPLAVSALHALGAGWETAGAAVSVASGIASVGLLFLWLRDAFGRPAAWAGGVLLAAHSRAIEYSSDVQSDGLYTALFLGALWLGWRALRASSPARAACAGALVGLAYLTRPEGLSLLLVLGACAVLEVARGPWIAAAPARWTLLDAFSWIGALAAGAALLVLPYVVALQHETGAWTLSPKRSVQSVEGVRAVPRGAPTPTTPAPLWASYLEPPSAEAIDPGSVAIDENEDGMAVLVARTPGRRAYAAAKMLARTAKSSMRYGVLALVALGLVASRGRPGPRARFLATLICVQGALLYAVTIDFGYVSRRHTLPALLPLLGYAGLGAAWAGHWALERTASLRGRSPHAASWSWVATGIVAAIAAGELARQIAPRRAEERAGRVAAEWLRANAESPGPVAAVRLRLGYYAGMPYVPLGGVAEGSLASYLERAGARYVVADDRERAAVVQRTPGLRARLLHQVEIDGVQAWVFALDPPPHALPGPEH